MHVRAACGLQQGMHTHTHRHTWDFHFAGGGGLKEMARWKKRNTKPGAKRPMEKMAAHCLEKRALKEKTEPSGEVELDTGTCMG